SHLGQVAIARGRASEAVEYLERSFSLLEQAGARAYAAIVLRSLGHASWLAGHSAQARATLEQGLALATASDNVEEAAIIASHLAELLAHEGDPAGAALAIAEALEQLRKEGDPLELARAMIRAARIHRMAGQAAAATHLTEEASEIFTRLGAGLDLEAAKAMAMMS
ncbi:MAG: tetratricopeptide repeat protein, partial [Cyanobacteria bacterium REEB65]|nr:tetratricopeptide repeat protein [Cyanobacteria bacterium REEB65]